MTALPPSHTQKHANKNKFLGMNFATAMNQLRKIVLFRMAQETGKDTCFQCGEKIATEKELTLEHKVPWYNNSVESFWDYENIAFSHHSCNSRASSGGGVRRTDGPEGTHWCNACEAFLPVASFGKKSSNPGGLQYYCKPCRKDPWRKR